AHRAGARRVPGSKPLHYSSPGVVGQTPSLLAAPTWEVRAPARTRVSRRHHCYRLTPRILNVILGRAGLCIGRRVLPPFQNSHPAVHGARVRPFWTHTVLKRGKHPTPCETRCG